MTNSQRIAHWLMLAWLAASAPTVAEQSQNYSAKPPFSAETFWHKALALLKEIEALREAHPGASAGAGDRQGHPDSRTVSACAGGEVCDHQPLYRLQGIFERAGLALARSTLAQWVGACGVRLEPLALALKVALLSREILHADETPVPVLKPGLGRPRRAYLWSYGPTQYDPMPAVVYDFADSRSGQNARSFLADWP